MKYKLLVLVLAIAFTIVAGSVWHKDDQYAAGLSDTPVVSGSVVKPAPDSSANEGQTKIRQSLLPTTSMAMFAVQHAVELRLIQKRQSTAPLQINSRVEPWNGMSLTSIPDRTSILSTTINCIHGRLCLQICAMESKSGGKTLIRYGLWYATNRNLRNTFRARLSCSSTRQNDR